MTVAAHTGIAMRQIAFLHLRAVGFTMLVLLTVAIAIDMTRNLDDVLEHAAENDVTFVGLLAEYLGYRAADIITRLLPMSCLIGGLIAELLRHLRLENVILSAAGAPPSLFFAALLAVGVTVGALQTALEVSVRPAAIWSQVDLGLGSYAKRFRRGERGPVWFTQGDLALRTIVVRDDKPEMRDVLIFKGIDADALSSITKAARAIPGAEKGQWILQDVVRWSGAPGAVLRPEILESLVIELPWRSTHVQYYGTSAFYLPQEALAELLAVKGIERTADAENALARRYLAFFLPGVFLFLGASISQSVRSGRMINWWRLLPMAVLGYVTLVSVKSLWALGEGGLMDPWISAFTPTVFAFCLAVFMQFIITGRLRR